MDLNSLPPSKVLIVDDNMQNLELLEAYMEVPGITTIRATNGEEALARVADARPDLILLDIMMPRMSGYEVCKALKRDRATADIPIIMVTALSEVSDMERGAESGTDDFVTKPVNRQDLLDRAMRLLRERHRKKAAGSGGRGGGGRLVLFQFLLCGQLPIPRAWTATTPWTFMPAPQKPRATTSQCGLGWGFILTAAVYMRASTSSRMAGRMRVVVRNAVASCVCPWDRAA